MSDTTLGGGRSRIWHPFANMGATWDELVLDRGSGVWVWDEQDRRYLDATASLWYCNVGHGRHELARAAAEQMEALAAYHTYDVYANRPAIELAELLGDAVPFDDGKVFFTSGGSDSIDTAVKIVQRYWSAMGEPGRKRFLVREGAYHGMHGFGTSLAGIEANRAEFGDLMLNVAQLPRDDLASVEAFLDEKGHEVAALFAEPVVGAGGVYPPPSEDYWDAVVQLCREHDVLVVMDEVVTGFGRLGHWFGCDRYGVQPDMIVVAKGITSGYMPLGAVVCGPRVQEPFFGRDSVTFRHGYTYSGHPTACAVALANWAIIRDEKLVERARDLEPLLASELDRLSDSPLVGEVRSVGLMAGVEIAPDLIRAVPGIADLVAREAASRGVLVRPLLGRTLQISPPLMIERAELRLLADVLLEALSDAVQAPDASPSPSQKAGPARRKVSSASAST